MQVVAVSMCTGASEDFTLVKIPSAKRENSLGFRVERQRLLLVVIRDVLLPGENFRDSGAMTCQCESRMDGLVAGNNVFVCFSGDQS